MTRTHDIDRTYQALKARYPRHVLFLRRGGVLEAYDDDALTVARVCGVTPQPARGGHVAYLVAHQAEPRLARLVAAGLAVAIAEPVEERPAGEEVEQLRMDWFDEAA
jgi:DNA mismatch repair ATPase MutS